MKLHKIPYSLVVAYCVINTFFVFNMDKKIQKMEAQLNVASELLIVHVKTHQLNEKYKRHLENSLDKIQSEIEPIYPLNHHELYD
jgi:hypothetical protein